MVEILILVAIIIGVRALYLWATKSKKDAKEFVDKSTNEVNQVVGYVALVGIVLLIFLIFAFAS